MLDATVKYLDTTLEPDTIFSLAEALQGMKVEDVEFVTLPGDEPDPDARPALVLRLRRGGGGDALPEHQALLQHHDPARRRRPRRPWQQQEEELAETETEADPSTVNLAVLNGARWEGMASQVAEIMSRRGYQDISTGNTVNPYEETTIYYAPGYEAAARMVARDLDPDGDYVIDEDADVAITYDADVILVIGKDYVDVSTPHHHLAAVVSINTSTTISPRSTGKRRRS